MIRLLEEKIKTITELKKIIFSLKRRSKRIIFTNGCFDVLHYGHVKYLQEAKKKGDILVVGINSDASVKRIKGKRRPFVSEHDRIRIIAALESIDYVAIFKENTPFKIISLLKPDVLVKGADWNKNSIVGKDVVLRSGGRVKTIKLIKGHSSTHLIKKIAKTL